MDKYQLVLCNVANEENAKQIAHSLLEKKLCACVNIIPRVHSLYIWDGEIEEASEYTMLIKSKSSLYQQLEEAITSLHPYDVPEIIAFEVTNGLADYLVWISKTTISDTNS